MPARQSSTATQQTFLERAMAELGLTRPRMAERLGVDLDRLRAWLRAPHHADSRRMPLRLQQKLRGMLRHLRRATMNTQRDTPEHWRQIKEARHQVQTGAIHAVRLDGELRFYQLAGSGLSKTFSCRRCGSPQRALALARAQAEAWGLKVGSGITGQREGVVRANSPTSAAGIRFLWLEHVHGPVLNVAVSRQEPDGRARGTTFSVERHGLEGALDMAIAARTRHGAPMPDRAKLLRELSAEYRRRAKEVAAAKASRTDRCGAPRGRSATGVAGIRIVWRQTPSGALMYLAAACVDGEGRARGAMYGVKHGGLESALDKAIALRTQFGNPAPDRRALLRTLRKALAEGPQAP